ncbi:hypothetical protein ACFT8W_04125 [Streptomyces hygroscopicus]|uniref:hypothetical protein n=1 Tax=Streptomyces hygroscopicus TaxID=1912 RepID=UPI00362F7F88
MGFTIIRKEHAWRMPSGEPTHNLEGFVHLTHDSAAGASPAAPALNPRDIPWLE